MVESAAIEQVVTELARAERALFITGAGISAESGLPTYRGIGGLYNCEDTEDGVPIEHALSGRMMAAQPAVCWKYLRQVELACRGARHNRAHEIIAQLERPELEVCVLTQNVDGFHRAAGSHNVIDIHGDLHELRCTVCTYSERVTDYVGLPAPPAVPVCPACGGTVRPDVVLFGELLPSAKVARMSEELARGFDIVFSVGTTSVFPYIAQPVLDARQRGVPTVEINPGSTEVTAHVQHKLAAGAVVCLEAIAAVLEEA